MGFSSEEIFRGTYARNFEQLVGPIDPNQSWDFSSYALSQEGNITRAREAYVSVAETEGENEGYYMVQRSTLEWMEGTLVESQNNKSLTKPFDLTWQEGSVFEIIPIFQGQAGMTWEFHMVIGDEDVKIWEKGEKGALQQKIACATCAGEGVVPGTCPTCNGAKTVECPVAHSYVGRATGTNVYYIPGTSDNYTYQCPNKVHNGTATKPCSACGVQSTTRGYILRCPTCGGDNKVDCSDCEGTGIQGTTTCASCNGTGETDWSNIGTGTNDNTLKATSVRAKPIQTDKLFTQKHENGELLSFYLLVTTGNNTYATTGTKQTSGKGMISILTCPQPTNINSSYTTYMLGCEDANLSGSDWDYNDVVFLITGYIPDVVYEDGKSETVISKRYLVEDLTSVGDFDFNDIVVDVKQTTTTWYKKNTETGNFETDPEHPVPVVVQEATVRWMGGTVPLQVKVGDTTFGKVTAPVEQEQTARQLMGEIIENPAENSAKRNDGYQPMLRQQAVTKTITGWNPDENNITVYVWWNGEYVTEGQNQTWANTFPERGSIPFMVATDTYDEPNWTSEGEDITETDWWKSGYLATQKK